MKRIFLLLSVLLPASLFFGEARAQILEEPQVQDNFYEKVNTKDKEPRPYVNVREADVYIKWRVWRTIDFRMKMNQYLYYPVEKTQDRISLMDLILEGMKDGIIVPYDPVSDQFNKPITYEEFQSQYTSRDTIEVESLDSAGLMEQRVVVEEFSPQDVKLLRLKEDWFIDKQRGVRDIRILGMCPVLLTEKDGALIPQSIFWLYYPSLRPLFARTESFNRHNSAMRQSYDDVFAWNRMFQSYIYKIDNLQDRQISQYAKGANTLREANRIEEMLFEIEHDLWVY